MVAIASFLARPRAIEARCPNDCSRHGDCGAWDKCTCFTGWKGAADCSLRSCPTGPRWTGKPYDASTAHTGAVECSNAGTCDRERGECDCFAGFTGDACQRVRCAKDCSNRGRCISVAEMALAYGSDSDQDGVGTAYTNWESSMNHICECDLGFTGPNCEFAVCPFGDDPDTIPGFDAVLGAVTLTGDAVTAIAVTTGGEGYNNPVITISGDGSGATATAVTDSNGAIASVSITAGGTGYSTATATITDEYQRDYEFSLTTGAASGSLAGTFELRFMGESVSFDADAANLDGAAMKAALESMASFKTVSVVRGTVDANQGAVYTVTVSEWDSGSFNNLFWHDGSPAASAFSCVTSGVTSGTTPTCAVATITTTHLKEFRQCAGRGACEPETGVCTCFVGYGDSNCATNTHEVVLDDSRSTFLIENTGLAFVGSVLKLTSLKAAADDFKFIEAVANDVAVFDVRGDGRVYVYSGGLIVEAGGIRAMADGLLVDDGGGSISSSVLTSPALTASAFGTPYTSSVILGTAQETAATTFNLLDLQASGSTSVFTVLGNGETVVKAVTDATSSVVGSLKTAGGMAVAKQLYVGGIVVTEDTTEATDSTTASVMHAGGVAVAKSLYAGIDIVAEGTTTSSSVGTGSLRTDGGLSVALDSYFGGTITATSLTDATSSAAAAVMIQGGLAVAKKSFFGDLLTVENNGIYVDAGGILVNAGGVEVTSGGLTVVAGGADVTGGANVKDGLVVETGGGVVKQDGASSAAFTALAESASFADSVLDVKSARAANPAFNLITAGAGETHVPGKTVTSSGTYSGAADAVFTVEVTAGDTYQWKKDSDPFTTGIVLHDTSALLSEGVYVTFSGTTGFITGASWTISVVAATDVVNAAAPVASSTVFFQLDGTGDLSMSTGDILLTKSGVQSIDHADASELQISSGGGVVVDDVTISAQAVSAVTTLDMSGDLTNSGGNILLTKAGVQTITHADASELQISSGGGVVVDDVTISAQAVSAVTTLGMSGDLTNSGGNILLTKAGVQTITHADASELQISAGGGVVVDDVTISAQAVSAVTTLGMSGDLTNSGGNILLTKAGVQTITHADASELQISAGGGVVVDDVTINTQAVSAVTTLGMSGDLTNSGGNILLTKAGVQTITHADASELQISAGGGVVVDDVTISAQAVSAVTTLDMSGDLTNSGGNILLTKAGVQTITHSDASELQISSGGGVVVDDVTISAQAVSAVTTLGMSGHLTNSAGNILLTSGSAQQIIHTGAAANDLSISSGGNVNVEGVLFNTNAVSAVSTLAMTDDLTMSKAAASITHSGATSLTISSTADVIVEGVTMNAGAISGATTVAASDDITLSKAAAAITHSGATSLTIESTSGTVAIESVVFTGPAISAVSTLGMSGDLTNSGGNILLTKAGVQTITHSDASELQISSGGGVVVDDVTISAQAVSAVTTLGMSGHLTNSAGNILLTSGSAQQIIHTGAAANDLSISSGGNVNVEGVLFNTNAVSAVSTLAMTDDLTMSKAAAAITHSGATSLTISSGADVIVNGVTMSGGAISGATTVTTSDDITLSKAAAAITHSGATSLTIESTSGTVAIESVVFTGPAVSAVSTLGMSGDLTNSGGNIALTKAGVQTITHSDASELQISSGGGVVVDDVTISAQAVSAVTTLGMSGHLTNSAGNILLTSGSAQQIIHTGAAANDLSISSGGNVNVEGVLFNTNAVSAVSTLAMTDDLTMSKAAASITHSGATSLTISSTADVIVEGVTMNAGAISGATTVAASDDITLSKAAAAITHSGATSLTIESTSGTVAIESVVFTGPAVSAVSTLGMSSDLTNSGGNILLTKAGVQTITHSDASELQISSGGGVVVDDVTISAQAVSAVTTLGMSGHLTNSAGNILLTSGSAQQIIHTGAAANDLSISSGGNVNVEGVLFNTNAVSAVSTLAMTDDLTMSKAAASITHSGATSLTISSTADVIVEGVTMNAGAISGATTVAASDDITLSKAAAAITHSGATSLTIESTSGTVAIESVVFTGPAVSAVTTLGMSGDLTNSGGNIALTKTGVQSITHSDASALVISSGGGVVVDDVTINAQAVSAVTTLDMSGDLTNSGGNIALTKAGVQTITHSDASALQISSGGGVVVDDVTINAQAVSAVTTLDMSGHLTNSAGNILLTSGSAQQIIHTGAAANDLSISSGGNVNVEGVLFNTNAVSAVSSLAMTDDLTMSKAAAAITHSGATSLTISSGGDLIAEGVTMNAGAISGATTVEASDDVTLSKAIAAITHSGATSLTIESTSGTVAIESVVFTGPAVSAVSTLGMSGDLTNSGGNIALTKAGVQTITHADASELQISSGGGVVVDDVTISAQAVSAVTTLGMSGHLTNSAGNILLTSGSAQQIIHTGAAANDLSISSGGNVNVEGVLFNTNAVSAVSSLAMTDDLTMSKAAASITHSGATSLTISSTADVIVEGVTMNAGAISGATTVAASDDITLSKAAAAITHSGATSLTIESTSGTVAIESVVFTGPAVSAVSTLGMSGDLTNSGGNIALTKAGVQTITHAHASELQISSGGGVVVDDVTVSAQAVSAVTTLGMSGHLTNSAGNILLTSGSAQQIIHTGAAANDLSISSGGNVNVEGVLFNTNAVSAVSSLAMTDDLTMSKAAAAITHSGATSLTISSGGDLIAEGVTMNAGAISGATTVEASDDVTLSKAIAAITHSGATSLTIESTLGTVAIESVVFTGPAVSAVSTLGMSGDLTNSGGNIALTKAGVQTITHADASELQISSGGGVVVDDVTISAQAVSAVTTLGMSGHLTNSAGNILLTSGSAQQIIHTGAAANDLSISSGGNVNVEGVLFNTNAVSAVSSLAMTDDLTMSKAAAAITHSGATSLTISSGGDLIAEGVTMNAGAISGATTVEASDDVTLSKAIAAITHSGATSLTIESTSGTVAIESVVFTGPAVSAVSTLGMSGDLTNSGGNIALTKAGVQTITHADASELQISSGGGVVVDDVTISAQAVSAVTTLGMSGHLTNSAGNILLTSGSAQQIIHTGAAANDLSISSGGNVNVEGVLFNTNAVSAVSSLAMTDDLTMSKAAAAITHSGATSLTISSGGDLIAEGVTMNAGAISGATTVEASDDVTLSKAAAAITHSGATSLTIESTSGTVAIESVVFTGPAVSAVSTLGMSGHLTNSAGNILLTSGSAQQIIHTGAAANDLSISSGGNVNIEGVLFNTNAVSAVSSLAMTDDLTMSKAVAAITHSGATSLTISSGGDLIAEGVTMNAGAISGATTVEASDDVTLSKAIAAITHSGATSLTIESTSGTVAIESVVFTGPAVSAVSTLGMSGDLTNSGGNIALTKAGVQTITHADASELQISSGGGVVVDDVTISAQAVSAVTTLGMSGHLTNSAGNILLTSGSAQQIIHTGAAANDLSISSGGNVNIEGVLFNTNAISAVSSLAMTDDLTMSKAAAAITHSGATSLTISSGGDLIAEGVTMNAGAISGATTLAASDDVTLSKAAATITHSGATSLTIESTSGTVAIESVVFTGPAVSAVTTLGMSGDLTNSGGNIALTKAGVQTITHAHASELQISSGGGVVVDDVTISAQAVSAVTTLGMSGHLTNSAGNILLTSGSAQQIIHTGAAANDLSISSGGNVNVEGVLFNTNAVSAVSSLAMTDDLTMSKAAAAITHSGATSLTISSGADVIVNGVTMSGGGSISGLSTLATSDDLTLSKAAAAITHSGATSLTIESTSGTVAIESVVFSGQAISNVATISVGGVQVIGSQQAAVADIGVSNDPGATGISSLTFSATPTQTEVEALRDECQKLRDWLNEAMTQVNDLLGKTRTHGLIAT